MEKYQNYGEYVIQYFPRLHKFRAFIRGEFGNYRVFNHQRDFNSLEDIKAAIDLDGMDASKIVSNDPYNTAIRWLRNASRDDKCYKLIELLVGEYYLGSSPKKELKELLEAMGVLKKS